MEKENCEHELFCIEEEWITNNKVKIKMQCSICNKIFQGTIRQDE